MSDAGKSGWVFAGSSPRGPVSAELSSRFALLAVIWAPLAVIRGQR
jgi:hypothetical protein